MINFQLNKPYLSNENLENAWSEPPLFEWHENTKSKDY